jgi:hypothetical protein
LERSGACRGSTAPASTRSQPFTDLAASATRRRVRWFCGARARQCCPRRRRVLRDVPPSQAVADAQRLRSEGFVAAITEHLRGTVRPVDRDAISTIVQFRRADSARAEVMHAVNRDRTDLTAFAVSGIPGARGLTRSRGYGRSLDVVFVNGRFFYLVGCAFDARAKRPPNAASSWLPRSGCISVCADRGRCSAARPSRCDASFRCGQPTRSSHMTRRGSKADAGPPSHACFQKQAAVLAIVDRALAAERPASRDGERQYNPSHDGDHRNTDAGPSHASNIQRSVAVCQPWGLKPTPRGHGAQSLTGPDWRAGSSSRQPPATTIRTNDTSQSTKLGGRRSDRSGAPGELLHQARTGR